MRPFNGGIRLGLEDYALQNAREDDRKIPVMTGPVLRDDDPVFEDVQVPIECWKVIVFVRRRDRRTQRVGLHPVAARLAAPGSGVRRVRHLPGTAHEHRATCRASLRPAPPLDVLQGTPEGTARPLLAPDGIRWR